MRNRVDYLQVLEAQGRAAIEAYLAEEPRGTEVTLAVFRALGREPLEAAARREGRSFDTMKKDVGIWVAILACDVIGEGQVETLRVETKDGKLRSASQRVPAEFPDLDWVGTYTPHRLCSRESGRPASHWRTRAAKAAASKAGIKYGVYDIWRYLLEQLPEDLVPEQAPSLLKAMASQAAWATKSLHRTAKKKASYLEATFGAKVAREVERRWLEHIDADAPPGLGRFRAFQLGFNAFDDHPVAAHLLLHELKRIANEMEPQDAVRAAEALASEPSMPFEGVARFSECLHLTQRSVFPFVNDVQGEIVAHLLEFEPGYEAFDRAAEDFGMLGREMYMKVRPWLLQIIERLHLVDANGLDEFLQSFNDLYDSFGEDVYWDEIQRFGDEVLRRPEALRLSTNGRGR